MAEPPVAVDARETIIVAPSQPAGAWSIDGAASVVLLHGGPVIMPPVARIDALARRALDDARYWHVAIGATFAPIPYDDLMRGTAWLAGPVAAADVAWPIGHDFALIGDVAVGAELAWGLGAGNPFTTGGTAASATLLPFGRIGVGAAWRATDRIELRVLPLAAEATLARGAFASDVPALRGFELRAGVAVAL